MNRAYPERPLVGVGAVIVDAARVVVVRRAGEPAKGQWSIPGGLIEAGETLQAAVVRETREETGLTVQVGELLEVFDRITLDAEGKVQYHFVLLDFLCRPVSGQLRASGDASEARWLTAAELADFPISLDAAEVLRKGLRRAEHDRGDRFLEEIRNPPL
ncbi:MAG TPA: NUDIX hydrolase [Terriglobales bacterium]|nr:NUDIX hydrolase [Terriglobales bacterium]